MIDLHQESQFAILNTVSGSPDWPLAVPGCPDEDLLRLLHGRPKRAPRLIFESGGPLACRAAS